MKKVIQISMIAAVFVTITSCGIRDGHVEDASWNTAVSLSETAAIENTTQIEATENTDKIENEEPAYDSEAYGSLKKLEKHYNNTLGQEGYYYYVDCFYFKDGDTAGKYSSVNKTLQQIYLDQEQAYQSYCSNEIKNYIVDETIENKAQQINYIAWFFNGIQYAGDDYVSLLFNEIQYSAGSAHPSSCFSPVTIDVKTGKTVTPEDVLNKSWDAIKADIQTTENEKDFNADYGFYLTQHTLTYIHRFNVFVDPIVINR